MNMSRFSFVGIMVNKHLRFKILSLVIIICVFSLLSMAIASYITIHKLSDHSVNISKALGGDAARGAEDALVDQAYHYLSIIANEQAHSCDSVLDAVKFEVVVMESVVRDLYVNPDSYGMTRPIVRPSQAVEGVYTNTYTFPAALPMTPGVEREIGLLSNLSLIMPALAQDENIIELYVGTENGLLYNYTPMTYENPDYDPRTRPWYQDALTHPGEVIITDVYEDAFGTGMVLSAAKAVYGQDGTLYGVAGMDIQLERLKELVLKTRIMDSGYAFILDKTGRYIVHPDMGKEGFDPIAGGAFAESAQKMMNGEEGIEKLDLNGEPVFLTFCPISVAGWSIGVVVYETEILSSLGPLNAEIAVLTQESEKDIDRMSNSIIGVYFIIFLLVAAMVFVLSLQLTRIVSNPIQKLVREVVKIGEGNFEYRIPVESSDEIGILTEAFNNMTDNLYQHAQNILSLQVEANTDVLTGLFNRRYFIENAPRRLENASIIIFDLDHFKKVNDTFGHAAGDQVLKTVAERVRRHLYPQDLCARYGGEEFIMQIHNTPGRSADQVVAYIWQSIRETPVECEGTQIPVTASFGKVAAYSGAPLETLITRADEALYKAKAEGRDRIVNG